MVSRGTKGDPERAAPASRFSQLVAEVGGESAAQLRATADATAAKRADRSCRGE